MEAILVFKGATMMGGGKKGPSPGKNKSQWPSSRIKNLKGPSTGKKIPLQCAQKKRKFKSLAGEKIGKAFQRKK